MKQECAAVPMSVSVRAFSARLVVSVALTGCAILESGVAAAQDAPIGIQRPRTIDAPRSVARSLRPTDFGDGSAAPDVPPAVPADDPGNVQADDGDDADAPTPRPGQRAVRRDGDLQEPEAPQLRDGVIDTDMPKGVEDGVDPTAVDNRPREEADLFENPASTVDALLFQTEDLDPILDRRPTRLFRFEPYDPTGIKVGSFVLFPEAEVAGSGLSNVFRSAQARSDVTFDVRPSARLVSNWQRHALELRASGLASFYNEFPTENERAYTLEVRGRLDITKRTNITTAISHDLAQESRSVLDARNVGTRADVTTDKVAVAFNHRFNRLSLQLRGSYTDQAFGDSTTASVTTSNASRNYATSEEALRASWQFKPALAGFGEVAVNQRRYAALDVNGIDRSSSGERYRTGLSFGTTGTFVRGEASIGYGVQHPSNAGLPDVSGVIVDANMTWRPTELTSVLLNARSDFGETTAAGVGGVHTQAVGVDIRHAIRRDLIVTAGITLTNADYTGSTLTEDELRATLGVEYFLNRETVLFSRYAHTQFTSNGVNASYDADEIRVGVRLRR